MRQDKSDGLVTGALGLNEHRKSAGGRVEGFSAGGSAAAADIGSTDSSGTSVYGMRALSNVDDSVESNI